LQRTGIGPALRKARLRQGKSLEEASRETRIRAEYLQALERESFDTFLGDVYVRGFLRSYSGYLGLDADKVLGTYNRHFGPPKATLPAPLPGPVRSEKTAQPHLLPLRRHHPSWKFLIAVAVLVIALLAAAGLFRNRTSPPAESIPSNQPSIGSTRTVTVAIRALKPVQVVVTVDGKVTPRALDATEGISVTGNVRITVELSSGASAALTVNGVHLGTPGTSSKPFTATYTPQSERRSPSGPSPSP
jgi:cytoskeleton protein RodZ